MSDIPTKVALITGAGSGIGRAAAQTLSRNGFAVVLVGRTESRLRETESRIHATDKTAHVLVAVADVSQPKDVAAAFDQTRERFGRVDVLFNNAGCGAPAVPLEEISYEQWQTVVNANLTGAFLCTQQAFRLMKSQVPAGGRIINNGSVSAQTPRPLSAPYTATKHAISGLTKSTALDGRPFNIACGQIDIGNAGTDMTEKMQHGVLQANGSTAVEPTMDVQHVADAVAYMAQLPLDANVATITVMATHMPLVGRG